MEAAGDADLSSWAVDQGEDQQQPPPLPAADFELEPRGGDSIEAVEAQVIELRRIVKVAAELVRAEEQELEYLGQYATLLFMAVPEGESLEDRSWLLRPLSHRGIADLGQLPVLDGRSHAHITRCGQRSTYPYPQNGQVSAFTR